MTAPAPAALKGRLGNGQLRRQVADWLAARPGPHTPGGLRKSFGDHVVLNGIDLSVPAGSVFARFD